ncbi:nicastrin isoform X2 [Folsomia candida]|nr:nicastrin isoform X2 [Folsomia candida]
MRKPLVIGIRVFSGGTRVTEFLAAVLMCLFLGVGADRTSQKIYEPIVESYPCFRKLNGTHQVGCGSSLTGDVGVVHLVENESSLQWVTRIGPHDPYVALIYPDFLTDRVMNLFKRSGRVGGILVLNDTIRIQGLLQSSPDLKCPNEGFGLALPNSTHYCENWNNAGESILFQKFDFPVFYVHNETESQTILSCYDDFNRPINGTTAREWPLCAAQLRAFMLAAVDTPTCLRRSDKFNLEQQKARVCDQMGDLNIWASVLPSNQSKPYIKENGSVIVISAKLDAASMFEGLAHGADSAGTGISTLLAVLKHLSQPELKNLLSNSSTIDNVYFILFHGETFGYIGSSRMVYDMKNGDFPQGIKNDSQNTTAMLNIKDIKYYIELGQLGQTDGQASYYMHDAKSPFSDTSTLTAMLKSKGLEFNLPITYVTNQTIGIPPASLQTFLKERPSIPGIFITNHENEFRNKFYNSMFDDAVHLQYQYQNLSSISTIKIAQLAATIASTVMGLAGSNVNIDPDFKNANDLLHCYLESGNCDIFQLVAGSDKMQPIPLDLYVGVDRHHIFATQLTRFVMMYYQGDNVTNITMEKDCNTPDDKLNVEYQWINGSCFASTVNTSQAVSPAFVIDNYDWTSGQYSTWTESVWQQFSVRIFVKPSRAHEIITLVSGILVFFISFVVVGWTSLKSDIIFPTR